VQPTVEVSQLVKRFGAFTAVDGVSFSIEPGEVFGLLGSNGAGKSTVIRMLCGLMTPTAGSARVLGIDVARDPEAVKHGIGYMTQRFSLYTDLSVRETLRFFGGVYGLRGEALAEREAWAIDLTDLRGKEDLLTGDLPGGWKQRLALACAVLHRPRMVFLDEPTGSVDPISRRRFWRLIDQMASDGVTLLVTTHYLDEAEHCGRLALMDAGRIVASGSVLEMKRVFAGFAVLEVACSDYLDALRLLERQDWVREASTFGTRLHLVVEDADSSAKRIRETLEHAGNQVRGIERIVPSLEDVFIHYIERRERGRPAGEAVS
jgi:ABC-2 type transport system ATP-binding protein